MASDEPNTYGVWVKDRVLGVGGFGIVTLWKNGDEFLALKKCRWENAAFEHAVSSRQKERWTLEVEIMKRLNHQNVVRFVPLPIDFAGMRSELPILSMEFCSLGDLRQVLSKPENCCGVQEPEVRRIIMDIKNAICYLHKERITHRDLKPENIVLQQNKDVPGEIVYKLIDLGYAKVLDHSSICNSFVGTLQYLAPELLYNSEYTSSVDYWSLGIVSHEVITGVRPFLPNMPPTQWMTHVQKKEPDEICAYLNVKDGKIIFRKELFNENYISQYLKEELEKWLRLALEWDPKKRGGPHTGGRPRLFSSLDKILQKKIVLVFCVSKYKKLSYEVDSATAVSTLKVWIERDASLPASDQLLLLPNGETLGDESLAETAWDPASADIMIYVLPKKGIQLPKRIQPYIPEYVKFLLQNSKQQLDFAFHRRICAHCIYFMDQELSLYRNLLDAYDVKMSWLIGFNDQLIGVHKDICLALERWKATHELVLKSLNADRQHYQETMSALLANDPSQRQILERFEQIILSQYEKLNLELQHQADNEETARAGGRRISAIKWKLSIHEKTALTPGSNRLNDMQTLLKAGHSCLMGLIREKKQERSPEIRTGKVSAYDLCKPVYNFLKVRDKALVDDVFSSQLGKLEECEDELNSLDEPVRTLLRNILASCQRILSSQLSRQEEFWKLCIAVKSHSRQASPTLAIASTESQPFLRSMSTRVPHKLSVQSMSRSISVNEPSRDEITHNSSHNLEAQGRPTSRPISAISESPVTPSPEPPVFRITNADDSRVRTNCFGLGNGTVDSVYNSGLETTSILNENESWRYEIMDCMAETHRTMQSMMSESRSMDWNSLLTTRDK